MTGSRLCGVPRKAGHGGKGGGESGGGGDPLRLIARLTGLERSLHLAGEENSTEESVQIVTLARVGIPTKYSFTEPGRNQEPNSVKPKFPSLLSQMQSEVGLLFVSHPLDQPCGSMGELVNGVERVPSLRACVDVGRRYAGSRRLEGLFTAHCTGEFWF